MAKSELLTQLAKAPLWQRVALGIGALVVVGAAFKFLLYDGLDEERTGLEQRKRSLIDKQKKLNEDIEDLKRLTQQNEELQRSIRDNQRALPTEAELPAFFDHLQRKAGDAGVSIRRWERREEQSVDAFVRVPVYVETSGTFYNIMRYFALLGPQRKQAEQKLPDEAAETRVDERLVSIENLFLGDPKIQDGEVYLTAKFTASTFRQQTPEEGGKQDAKADPKAGAKADPKAVPKAGDKADPKAAGQKDGGKDKAGKVEEVAK